MCSYKYLNQQNVKKKIFRQLSRVYINWFFQEYGILPIVERICHRSEHILIDAINKSEYEM